MTRQQREQLDMFPDSPDADRIRANEALALRYRIKAILRNAAVEIRPCKACRTQLFFLPMGAAKKLIPYEADGQNHFTTCPKAAEFSKKGKTGNA